MSSLMVFTTQLHVVISADNTATGLFCSCCVYRWRLDSGTSQNGLQLNQDKSKSLNVDTANHLCICLSQTQSRPNISSLSVTGVDLPVAEDMTVLGIVLDRRMKFYKHVSTVARSRNAVLQVRIQRGLRGLNPQKSLHKNFWVYFFPEWPWQLILIHAILAGVSVEMILIAQTAIFLIFIRPLQMSWTS